MPQMMPLNWIYMFIQLSTMIFMIMVLLFFLSSPTPPNLQNKQLTSQTSWKW